MFVYNIILYTHLFPLFLRFHDTKDASRFYFGEHNPDQAIARLKPLHEMLEKGPETLVEAAFQHSDGRDLQEGWEWTNRYKKSGMVVDMNQAWDLYHTVYKRVKAAVNSLSTLELEYVSPKLLAARVSISSSFF